MKTNDLRWSLHQEFDRRKANNARYSLRAFAASLGIPVSTLSAALSGKRNMGAKVQHQVLAALGAAVSRRFHAQAAARFSQLSLDQFALIAGAQHYEFLELLGLKDFRPDTAWAAARLGVRVTEAKATLSRLVRLGMIEILPDGNWKDRTGGYTSHLHPGMTSVAARKHQRELLESSIRSLDRDAIEVRDHTSATFAFKREKMAEAKELIKEFRRKLSQLIACAESGDDVYTLQISLFPNTRSNNQNQENEV